MTTIVIPNWNGEDFLAACLASLQKQTMKATIVVVDNGSHDTSRHLITTKFPQVELIELDKNYGFAGGVNAGIKFSLEKGAEFIALFNNDAVAQPDWLERLVQTMRTSPQIGIVTGKLLAEKRGEQGYYIDSTGDFLTRSAVPTPRGRGQQDRGQYDQRETVFAASGGASLYRAELFRQIGLFDERFFAYFEDVDISFRARLRGWEVMYEPTAVAYHRIGGTSSRYKHFGRYYSLKNAWFLYLKNMPLELAIRRAPRFLAKMAIFNAAALKHGAVKAMITANFNMLIHLPSILKSRRHIQRNLAIQPHSLNQFFLTEQKANNNLKKSS